MCSLKFHPNVHGQGNGNLCRSLKFFVQRTVWHFTPLRYVKLLTTKSLDPWIHSALVETPALLNTLLFSDYQL